MPDSGLPRRPNPVGRARLVWKTNGLARTDLRNSMSGIYICEADHVTYRPVFQRGKLVTSDQEECDDHGQQACSPAAAGVAPTPLDHAQLYRERHRTER